MFTICLDLRLFMLYICDLFFIFIFIFTMINHINLMNTDTLVMSFYSWIITWMKDVNSFQITKVQPQGVA